MHQDASWYGGRPPPRGLCVRWGLSPPLPKKEAEPGAEPPDFRPVYCGQTAGWIKMALDTEVGLGPGHIVLDGEPAPLHVVAATITVSDRQHVVTSLYGVQGHALLTDGDAAPLPHRRVHVRYLLSPVRLSSVCNVHAPYSGVSNFRQYFYGIRCLGHPLTSTENFTEIFPGEPLRRGS